MDDFFCTYIEGSKLDTKKLKLKIVKYQIEFTLSIVLSVTHKNFLFLQHVKKFAVPGIHLEFIAFSNQASIFNVLETPSKFSIN